MAEGLIPMLLRALAAFLLFCGVAHAQELFPIQQIPSGGGIQPPPYAQAAGYTVWARNSDFTTAAPTVDCTSTVQADWYTQFNGIMGGDCASIAPLVTDPKTGAKAFRVSWNPNDPGASAGRQGIISASQNFNTGGFGTSFPVHSYYECTARYAATLPGGAQIDFGSTRFPGTWNACWSWWDAHVSTLGFGAEIDNFEYHSMPPLAGSFNPGELNWNTQANGAANCPRPNNNVGFTCFVLAYFNLTNENWPNPSDYHKYGALVTSLPAGTCNVVDGFTALTMQQFMNGPGLYAGTAPQNNVCLQLDFYLDDVYMVSEQFPWDGFNERQRRIPMVNVGSGCGMGEGVAPPGVCNNQTVVAANADANGNLVLTLAASNSNYVNGVGNVDDSTGGPAMYLQGIGGNVPDGMYNRQFYGFQNNVGPFCGNNGGATHPACQIQVFDQSFKPVKFVGPYTGGGTINPLASFDVYIQSARVASCPNWPASNEPTDQLPGGGTGIGGVCSQVTPVN